MNTTLIATLVAKAEKSSAIVELFQTLTKFNQLQVEVGAGDYSLNNCELVGVNADGIVVKGYSAGNFEAVTALIGLDGRVVGGAVRGAKFNLALNTQFHKEEDVAKLIDMIAAI